MPAADRPVYLQLRDRIAESILEGRYREGDMLPSVRAFAAEQGANPLTVAKAYQLFQEEGLVIVKRGVGMFVAEGATRNLLERERRAFLNEEWPRIRSVIDRLRIDPAELFERA
jgi:GntR family transcriptional regulator